MNKKLRLMLMILFTMFAAAGMRGDAFASDEDFTYYYDEELGGACITLYTGSEENLVIPDELGGYKVTEVYITRTRYMVSGANVKPNETVRTISIPDGVSVLVLDGLTALECVNVDENNQTYKSQDGIVYSKDGVSVEFIPPKMSGRVALAEGAVSMWSSYMYLCNDITELVIPSTLVEFELTRYGLRGLECVSVSEDNPNYSSEDGVLYDKSKETLVYYPINKDGDFIIPDCVKTIDESAFENSSQLTSLTFGGNITEIKAGTFTGCAALREIILSEKLSETYEFADGIMYNKKTESAVACLYSVSGEVKVREGTKSIGENAFRGCNNITKIIIPQGVSYIGSRAFINCRGLQTVELPEGLTSIETSAFDSSENLKSVNFPESLESIGSEAFFYTALSKIAIPESVSYIGDTAFYSVLTSMEIHIKSDKLTYIGSLAFYCETDENMKIYAYNKTVYDTLINMAYDGGLLVYPANVVLVETNDPLELSKSKVTLYTGSKKNAIKIKAVLNGISGNVKWTSSDKKVAGVKNGKITALSCGKTEITAGVGEYEKTVQVTVKNPKVTMADGSETISSVKVKRGKTGYYRISTNPVGEKVKVSVTSKNGKLIKVTLKNGNLAIRGIKKGNATFKLKCGKGSRNIKVKVA